MRSSSQNPNQAVKHLIGVAALVVVTCSQAMLMQSCKSEDPTRFDVVNLAEDLNHGIVPGPGEDPGPGNVSIRPGSEASCFLRLTDQSFLTLAKLEPPEEPGASLSVHFEADEFGRVLLQEFRGAMGPTRIDLPLQTDVIAKITLSASATASEKGGEWNLLQPELHLRKEHRPSTEPPEKSAGPKKPPNIVVYLSDALRDDFVGAEVSGVKLTPNADAFSASATVYNRALAQSPWTRPSVASIFTGVEPHRHSVNRRKDSLADEAVTLAELLSSAGYFTGSANTNGNIGPEFGLAQGFDYFSKARNKDRSSKATTDRALEFFSEPEFREPFFLYVHNLDPHHPYEVAEPEFERFAPSVTDHSLGSEPVLKAVRQKKRNLSDEEQHSVEELYTSEVAYMDREFGRLLDTLKSKGYGRDTVVVFLSDHGEGFWDHGSWGHGVSLYWELIDIPLMIRYPGQDTQQIDDRIAQHIDVFATILDLAGVDRPDYVSGVSLLDASTESYRQAYIVLDLDRVAVGITDGQWKFVLYGPRGGRRELFDLTHDPFEKEDVADSRPIVCGYFEAMIQKKKMEPSLDASTATIGDELREQLEALGYL
jgi:arylsulfatase A-like enzyme